MVITTLKTICPQCDVEEVLQQEDYSPMMWDRMVQLTNDGKHRLCNKCLNDWLGSIDDPTLDINDGR